MPFQNDEYGNCFCMSVSSCMFNNKECGEDNITSAVTDFGMCYTFNAESEGTKRLKSQKPGEL